MPKSNKSLINNRRFQQGLTLVELIVALALGVVLVGGITRVYIENKKNYVQDDELARVQENGRFVLNILKRELKMAGFMASIQDIPPANPTVIANNCMTGWALNPAKPIDFFNGPVTNVSMSTAGDSFAGCIPNPGIIQPGTDIISIKRTAGVETVHNGIFTATKSTAVDMKPNSFYIRTVGEINPTIQYVGLAFAPTDLAQNANTALQVGMWLYKAKVFYVRNYSINPGDQIPTLMMISLEGQSLIEVPLIEGVEAFNIEFGIPSATTTPTPEIFVPNPTSAQITDATVIRLYLLMRTRNPMKGYNDTKSYRLGSMPAVTPGGPFMRRVFTTTIKIRNI